MYLLEAAEDEKAATRSTVSTSGWEAEVTILETEDKKREKITINIFSDVGQGKDYIITIDFQ